MQVADTGRKHPMYTSADQSLDLLLFQVCCVLAAYKDPG